MLAQEPRELLVPVRGLRSKEGSLRAVIDLRSDTATRPTAGMRAAIAAAAVGDEQKREDPTVNELEERARAAARPGRGDLPADRDDGEPDRDPAPHRARRRAARRGELPRLHLRARRPGRPLRRRHARPAGRGRPLQRRAGARRVPRPGDPLAAHAPALGREHPQRERRPDLAAGGDRRAARARARARPALPPRRRAPAQRRPSRSGSTRPRSAAASTPSRSASRRGSAARSARSSPAMPR